MISARLIFGVLIAINYATGEVADAAEVDGATITLERTACFGSCPIYSVAIRPNGEVVFRGEEFVRDKGEHRSRITSQEYANLAASLSALAAFRDQYRNQKDGCDQYWTDSPSLIISTRSPLLEKRVEVYFGCKGGVAAVDIEKIAALGTRIDQVAATRQWIGSAASSRPAQQKPGSGK